MTDEELLRAAEALAHDVIGIASWVDGEAGVDLPRREAQRLLDALEKRATAKRAAEVAERRAKRAAATSLADVARGLVEDFEAPDIFPDRRITIDPYTEGRHVLTDGTCLLVADLAGVAASARGLSLITLGSVARQCDGFAPHKVTADALKDWLASAVDRPRIKKHVVRIGEAVLDAALVERWVLDCARVAPGPVTVRACGDTDPVRFDGAGWAAIVMPLRLDDRDGVPQLLAEGA